MPVLTATIRARRSIPPTVVALGAASLLTDLSSEMIYPLLPLFLSTVLGAGPLYLGLIEGVAEAVASILKILSGIWTDRTARRKPIILLGYGISGAMRPLIGLAGGWTAVFGLRLLDRVGKGIRTSPRDTLIADAVPPEHRGAAYGFHRMMDHAGAVMGPLVAAALIAWAGLSLRSVFLCAAIPAAMVMVVLALFVKEPARPQTNTSPHAVFSLKPWREFAPAFKWVMLALFVFTLGNSSDAFILLLLGNAGIPPAGIAVLWSIHHVVKMVSSYAGGVLSDKFGRRALVLAGWAAYAACYLGFALIESQAALVALFLAYGICFGLMEPSEKAWVAELAPARLRGTAIGYYHGIVGMGSLPAGLIFGGVWHAFGAPAAFGMGAALAFVGSAILLAVRTPRQPAP